MEMQGAEAIRAEAYSKYVEHRIAEVDAAAPPASTADCRVGGGFGGTPLPLHRGTRLIHCDAVSTGTCQGR